MRTLSRRHRQVHDYGEQEASRLSKGRKSAAEKSDSRTVCGTNVYARLE
jgi:hypothetical protein